MTERRRPLRHVFQGLTVVGAVAIAGGLIPSLGLGPLSASAQTGATVEPPGIHGTATLARVVNVSQLGHQGAAASDAATPGATGSTVGAHAMPLRPAPAGAAGAGSSGASAQVAAPSAAPKVGGDSLTTGSLLQSFEGINSTQNLQTSHVGLEPPDEGLAEGDGYVVNIVNLAFSVYNSSGVTLGGPFSVDAFFGHPQAFTHGSLTSDPRVYFDPSTGRWFSTVLEYFSAPATPASQEDIAVSQTSNPLGNWDIYHINSTDPSDNGCPCFGDYPILGIDAYNFYLETQEFSITGSAYNGAQIYALPKSTLESGASTVRLVHYGNLSIAGVLSYHIQPAVNPYATSEFFLMSLDPNGTFDNRLSVWAISNPSQVGGGGIPTLSAMVISSETYGFPVNAVTPPGFNGFTGEATTGLVTPDFDAMEQVQNFDNNLYGALNTAVTIPGDTSERDGVAWFEIHPTLYGGVLSGATMVAQGYLAVAGEYLLYPVIAHNSQGDTALAFSYGGPSTYLSSGYAVMASGQTSFGPVQTAASGVAPDNGFTGTKEFGGVGRWGDYSAWALDPSGNFWLATQYIPGNGDQIANWGNRVFEVGG